MNDLVHDNPTEGTAGPQGTNLERKKLVVGLVGGIGSGKSEVAASFARYGARVLSADELAHQALRDPEIRERIVQRWGKDLLDEEGEIRRRQLGKIVFADDAQRKELEGLVHPWIKEHLELELARLKEDPSVALIIVDAAIMLEAGWAGVCDRLVFVDTPYAIRLHRIRGQRNWTEEEVQERERAQMPLTEKAARADHVLDNSKSLDHLHRQVDALFRNWIRDGQAFWARYPRQVRSEERTNWKANSNGP